MRPSRIPQPTRLAVVLGCIVAAVGAPVVVLDTDEKPIQFMQATHEGERYFIAWCLPGKGVSRRVVLLSTQLPARRWLSQTPKGHIRAAINGPLFNSDSGVPFNEVGLGGGKWVSDPKWSPCPVQRYCFGMDGEVSVKSTQGFTRMARCPYPPSVPQAYYHVPDGFRSRYPYGFSGVGLLLDCSGEAPAVLSSETSDWARMFPETDLARSALVWTDRGDFIMVEAESATWHRTGEFIAHEITKLRPWRGECHITGAIMLDGGSTAQFGWAQRRDNGELIVQMPVEQANERQVVPLIVGVEGEY